MRRTPKIALGAVALLAGPLGGFTSTVHYQGATLQGDGGGTVTSSGITGTGRAYGGTGALAGVQGRGEFWSTGPDSFADLIWYIYPNS